MAGLLGIAAAGIVAGRRSWGSNLVYGASLLASLIGLVAALWHLSMGPSPELLSFALGLPGVGANFRLDALASFFLVIVILVARPQASTPSAMAGTNPRRFGCCRSSRPISRG